jgi:hypothetical protein
MYAPLEHIPSAKERSVPQFQVRGTNDRLVLNDDVQELVDAILRERRLGVLVGYAGAMKAFFESVLY